MGAVMEAMAAAIEQINVTAWEVLSELRPDSIFSTAAFVIFSSNRLQMLQIRSFCNCPSPSSSSALLVCYSIHCLLALK